MGIRDRFFGETVGDRGMNGGFPGTLTGTIRNPGVTELSADPGWDLEDPTREFDDPPTVVMGGWHPDPLLPSDRPPRKINRFELIRRTYNSIKYKTCESFSTLKFIRSLFQPKTLAGCVS